VSATGPDAARVLLLVDHGSRRPEAHAHLAELAARVEALAPGWRARVAHMEIATPSIEEALAECAQQGAEEVVVLPLFLTPGRHLAADVPDLVARGARRHPALRVRVAPALGEAEALPELIVSLAGLRAG
jgi:sirohydrochlorin ferrochelatase